jgi:hypothetical protein
MAGKRGRRAILSDGDKEGTQIYYHWWRERGYGGLYMLSDGEKEGTEGYDQ